MPRTCKLGVARIYGLDQAFLNKNPATTFVIIEEVDTDNWGIAGKQVTELRKRE